MALDLLGQGDTESGGPAQRPPALCDRGPPEQLSTYLAARKLAAKRLLEVMNDRDPAEERRAFAAAPNRRGPGCSLPRRARLETFGEHAAQQPVTLLLLPPACGGG